MRGDWPFPRRDRLDGVLLFVALLASALALGAAHLLELPSKIGLPQLACLLAVQLLAMLALAVRLRHRKPLLRPVLVSILSLLSAQAVFWIWTFPANQATADWTIAVAGWLAGAAPATGIFPRGRRRLTARRHRCTGCGGAPA